MVVLVLESNRRGVSRFLFRALTTAPFIILFFEYYITGDRWDISQDGISV